MPLDGASLDETRWMASFALRTGQERESSGQARLHELQKANQNRKQALFAYERFRKEQKNTTKSESKLDRKAVQDQLTALIKTEQEARDAHTNLLESMPNYVDEQLIDKFPTIKTRTGFSSSLSSSSPSSSSKAISVLAMDDNPLFELCLYERLDAQTIVWTTKGSALLHALSCYLIENCALPANDSSHSESAPFPSPQVLFMPSMVLSDITTAQPPPLTSWVPSWIKIVSSLPTLLLASGNGTLLDRQLPRYIILSGPVENKHHHHHHHHRPLSDPMSIDTSLLEFANPVSSWSKSLSTDQYISAIILTGPSLTADSRPLQQSILHHYQRVLEKLPNKCQAAGCIGGSVDRTDTDWQIVAVPPSDLEPFESSRLVLQVLASPRNGSDEKPAIPLSYRSLVSVSNMESYTTVGRLKHATTGEPLHMLLVKMAPLSWILEWMVRYPHHKDGTERLDCPDDGRKYNDDDTSSFQIPRCLLPWMTMMMNKEHDGVFHVERRMEKGKNGKRSVQPVKRSQPLRTGQSIPFVPSPSHREKVAADRTRRHASDERIHAESLSCPFSFLPFYSPS